MGTIIIPMFQQKKVRDLCVKTRIGYHGEKYCIVLPVL